MNPLPDLADIPNMLWIIVATILISLWAFLNILGGERDRRLQEIQIKAAQAASDSR